MQIQLNYPSAVARIKGDGDAMGITGTVRFYQQPGGVVVLAKLWGLPENGSGFYGFHIHAGSSCGEMPFGAAGGHFNPKGALHPAHAGDLPNLYSCGGRAFLAVLTDRFSIKDILGRTVVIHGRPDDFRTQPSGNAGEKIACGVILPVAGRK